MALVRVVEHLEEEFMSKDNEFDKAKEPFGSAPEKFNDDHMSGYHQPVEFIETLSKEDVKQLLAPMLFEEIEYRDRGLKVVTSWGAIHIMPVAPWASWGDDEAIAALYIKYRVSALKYNDFHGLAEMNLRFPRLKVFINNSGRLCFGVAISVKNGVSIEHVQEVFRDFIRDIDAATKSAKSLMEKPNVYIADGIKPH